MLQEARALMEELRGQLSAEPTVLFCGDLNSDLNDGLPGEYSTSSLWCDRQRVATL